MEANYTIALPGKVLKDRQQSSRHVSCLLELQIGTISYYISIYQMKEQISFTSYSPSGILIDLKESYMPKYMITLTKMIYFVIINTICINLAVLLCQSSTF